MSPSRYGSSYVVPLLCLLVLSSLPAFSAAQVDVANITILSISGCTDVGLTTVNCSFPATLTLLTSGFGALQVSYQSIVITGQGVQLYSSIGAVSGPTLNDSVTFTLAPQGYAPAIFSQLLSVAFIDSVSGQQSAPFAGLSFAYTPPPTLSSIAGCTGSGAATLNCVPESSVLTIQGFGLGWLSTGRLQLCVAAVNCAIFGNDGVQVVNDSYAVVQLSDVLPVALLPVHYNGVLLPLSFRLWVGSGWSLSYATNALNVSFVPLPPPSVSKLTATSCAASLGPSNQTVFTQCLPILSLIDIRGAYLYGAQVTVGGVPCTTTSSTAYFAACLLPAVPNYAPNLPYDVVVTTTAGSVTLTGAVAFRDGPVLTGLSRCIDYAGPGQQQTGGGCQPGTAITLSGFRFVNDSTVTILLQTIRSPLTNLSCLQPAFVNSTTLSCVLPPASAATMPLFIGQYGRVLVAFNLSSVFSNFVYTTVIDYPNPPLITAIGGSACAVTDGALAVSSCSPGGQLELYGTNLYGTGVTIGHTQMTINGYSVSQFYCPLLTVTDTAITIALPQWGEGLPAIQPNVTYIVTGYETNAGLFRRLNAFTVAFAVNSPSVTGGTGGSNRFAIIFGISLPVVVLSLVALAVLVRRRRMRPQAKADEATELGSSMAQHASDVEMK